jgi:hypothetical protein
VKLLRDTYLFSGFGPCSVRTYVKSLRYAALAAVGDSDMSPVKPREIRGSATVQTTVQTR